MRIVGPIDEAAVIWRILRHLRLWDAGVRVESTRSRIPKRRVLDPPSPLWQRLRVEITASSLKLRANAPEGCQAISYQQPPALDVRWLQGACAESIPWLSLCAINRALCFEIQ